LLTEGLRDNFPLSGRHSRFAFGKLANEGKVMNSDDSTRPAPRSQCELVGGPLDGAKFDVPDTQQVLKFEDPDNTFACNIYEREADNPKFLYRGRERLG
jgi:hypothetical protein